ncbi:TadE/TadG family type IV pilus assembly protein [Hoeflea prorocentri]|uniref:Pilus assembly protein n=1 Tax=Hoeflea prorocentri TaxID=1922333 RepID=A0A9X3UJC6_9HYPH|nr:TadE/TadG family type IV pilus assembly protein [Hoeflea prorocentri]MCY6382427.1 pilus assembly protein [Hoeflea prorocentri]MDA5400227.1 pilus assembly protein [Hoeflea prorocentri]
MFVRYNKGRKLKSFDQCISGVAAIELAIIFPVFIFLFAGLINFGYLIFLHHNMQDVAGDTLRSVIYGELDTSVAANKATDELDSLYGEFEVVVRENSSTNDITVTITADAKSSTLMPLPLVSADLLTNEIGVTVTSPRITQFNPANI